MSITFKIKRGSSVQNEVFTGQEGELTMITDSSKESVVLHDGTTQGGVELARRDLANVQIPLGGVTFEYRYESSAVSTNPGNGRLGFDGTLLAGVRLADNLYVSELDQNGTSLKNFLATIATVSNAVVGHFRLYKKTNAAKFMLFQIEKATDSEDFFNFDIKYLNDSLDPSTMFADDEEVVLSYQRSGDDGLTVMLTKDSHVFESTTSGVIENSEYAAGAFQLRVFLGHEQAKYSSSGAAGSYTVTGGNITYTPSSGSGDGITLSVATVNDQLKYTPSAMDSAVESVVISIPIVITKANGKTVTTVRDIVYSKNKLTKNVSLTSDDYQIAYDTAKHLLQPKGITLTATAHAFTNPVYKFYETNPDVKYIKLASDPGDDWREGDRLTANSGGKAKVYKKINNLEYVITDIEETETATIDTSETLTNSDLSNSATLSELKTYDPVLKQISTDVTNAEGHYKTTKLVSVTTDGDGWAASKTHEDIVATGGYGKGFKATVTTDSNGDVSALTSYYGGFGYRVNDVLTLADPDSTAGNTAMQVTVSELYENVIHIPEYSFPAWPATATAGQWDYGPEFWLSYNRFTRRLYSVNVYEQTELTANASADPLSTDSATVFGTLDGDNSLTVVLTNPVFNFQANEQGVVTNYAGSGTDVEVYWGNKGLTFDNSNSGTQASGTWRAVITDTNIDVGTVSAETNSYEDGDVVALRTADASDIDAQQAVIQFAITAIDTDGKTQTRVAKQNLNYIDIGNPAQTLELAPDTYTYIFDNVGDPEPTAQTLTLTAFHNNLTKFNSTVTWAWTVTSATSDGGSAVASGDLDDIIDYVDDNTTATATLPVAQFKDDNGNFLKRATIQVTATFYDTTSTTTTLSDTVTLVKLREGSGVVEVVLEQEAVNFPARDDGHVLNTYQSHGSTEIRVYDGVKIMEIGTAGALNAGEYYLTTSSPGAETNIDVALTANNSNPDYYDVIPQLTNQTVYVDGVSSTISTIDMDADAASATIACVAQPYDASKDAITQTKKITYNKARTGTAGVAVKLEAGDYQIAYGGVSPYNIVPEQTDPIEIKATHVNFKNPRFKFYEGTTLLNPTLNNGFQSLDSGEVYATLDKTTVGDSGGFDLPDTKNWSTKSIKVEAFESTDTSTVLATDSLTLISTRDGSNVSQVQLSNPLHTFATDSQGTVLPTNSPDYSSGKTSISVYDGNLQLEYKTDLDIHANNYSPSSADEGKFKVHSVTGSGISVTDGVVQSDGTAVENGDTSVYTTGYGNMQSDSTTVTIVVDLVRHDGTFTEIEAIQSISKNVAGSGGSEARILRLNASGQVFNYDQDNNVKDATQVIQYTAHPQNLGSSPEVTWSTTAEASVVLYDAATGNTTVTQDTPVSNHDVYLRVGAFNTAIGSSGNTVKVTAKVTHSNTDFEDALTAYKIRDGEQAIQILPERDSHVFAADKDGIVDNSLQDSGKITYTVVDGSTTLAYDANGGEGTWYVDSVAISDFPGTNTDTINLATAVTDSTSYTVVPGLTGSGEAEKINFPGMIGGLFNDIAVLTLTFKIQGTNSTTVITRTKELIYSKSRAGSNAENLVLSADSQVFKEIPDTVGGAAVVLEPTEIKFTAALKNLPVGTSVGFVSTNSTTLSSASVDSALVDGENVATVTLTKANFGTATETVVTATVTGTESQTIVDKVTIHRLKEGSGAITPVGANPVTLAADKDGDVSSFAPSVGSLKLFQGTTLLTPKIAGTTLASGEWKIEDITATNFTSDGSTALTVAYITESDINETTKIVTLPAIGGLSTDSGTIVFDIKYKTTQGTTEESLEVRQAFSKSKAGQNSRSLKLKSDDYTIAYDKNNAAIGGGTPQITLSVNTINFDGNPTVTYEYYNGNAWASIGTAAADATTTFSFDDKSAGSNNTDLSVYPWKNYSDAEITSLMIRATTTESSVSVEDIITVYATNLTDSGFTVILTNENHSFATDSSGGGITYANGATSFQVERGSRTYTYDDSSPYGNETFRVTQNGVVNVAVSI